MHMLPTHKLMGARVLKCTVAPCRYAHSKQAIAVYNKSKGTLRVLGVCSGQPLLVLADGKAVPGPDDAAAVADKRPQGELDAAARRLQNKMWVPS